LSDLSNSSKIASSLLGISAVSIVSDSKQAFQYASGLKGPIYCDNRKVISHPVLREMVMREFVALMKKHSIVAQLIAGTATAGIPHAAWLSQNLELPMVYVRSKGKAHGTGKLIEGDFSPGQEVLLIEDLVTTGGSALKAIQVLQEAELNCVGCLSIFDYGHQSVREKFKEAGTPFHPILTLDELLSVGSEEGALSEEQVQTVLQWRDEPQKWGENS